jgi:molybdopterin converting factor small subunit
MSASMLEIDVLLFASFADAFGSGSLRLTLPPGATVQTVTAGVREAAMALPGAPALPATFRIAVNQALAGPEQPVVAGDEVAVIPPVAGG